MTIPKFLVPTRIATPAAAATAPLTWCFNGYFNGNRRRPKPMGFAA